jgi:translation initiation factor 3 subunit C
MCGLNDFRRRIQEQGLRTYLFTYAPHYTTLSLSLLSKTFSLPLRSVTSIISKMIWGEELSASLDQSAGVVVFQRIEFSRQQQLSQSTADKIAAMLDQNEKVLDMKLGGVTGWVDRSDGTKNEKRGEQTQERRGRGERTRGKDNICDRQFESNNILVYRRWCKRKRHSFLTRFGKSDARTL